MGKYFEIAEHGKQFVLTECGYKRTPDTIKHERKVGKPVKGFENRVPSSWVKNGWVVMG